ncbi:hypothetical protein D5278_06470 [bacterium 1XD21-13]|nr:hypothetical protein [bacterium 1XD21-13]
MKKLIKMLPPKAVTAMLVVAALLLLSGSVGGTRAALTYYSDTYSSRIRLDNIGVTLEEKGVQDENWKEVSWRNYDKDGNWEETKLEEGISKPKLLTGMLAEGENLKIGKKYQEELRVKNTGSIDQYVRVTIYKYWVDENGNKLLGKDLTLDPAMIDLKLANAGDWIEDTAEGASTPERIVLYYNKRLPVGGVTSNFTESLTIDQKITKMVTEEISKDGEFTTIKSTYDYDGKQFHIEVQVDAVQDHNAEDAILSAWGRDVTIIGETLRLN